ncbi:Aste57867_16452 [Aphanomyces stellatus]|uniref:Aste57867_16452 protein n=1 Tax=Aphanomyces stellatus TaxID=120398 RepID=A0A485L6A3_9STRA|nr:hypothetical protein As57867_016395 [Aphanomyces stellatus]VFT93226.1 Aste57867_16452 [Aphanomyces stellatus]
MMEDPDDVEARREYECQRKRRYRAQKRCERDILQAEVDLLQEQLETQLQDTSKHNLWRVIARRAFQDRVNSMHENATLREQVRRHRHLLRMLRHWATAVPDVPTGLGENNPWINSTLLADPTARQYGFQWLTDRVFHSTLAALSFVGTVDDVSRVDVHTDDSSGQMEIMGIESHFQRTYFADYKQVADINWDEMPLRSESNPNIVQTIVRAGCINYVHMYYKVTNQNVCVLVRRYNLPNRVVIVRTFLRDDECIPLQGPDMRPYGYGWAVFENIADGVTLYRSRLMQHAPVTRDGVITFDQTAAIFGVPVHPCRHVTLARIENNALRNFLIRREITDKTWTSRLDALGAHHRQGSDVVAR